MKKYRINYKYNLMLLKVKSKRSFMKFASVKSNSFGYLMMSNLFDEINSELIDVHNEYKKYYKKEYKSFNKYLEKEYLLEPDSILEIKEEFNLNKRKLFEQSDHAFGDFYLLNFEDEEDFSKTLNEFF